MDQAELQRAAREYGTDKAGDYLANYVRELGHLADRPIALLELGVREGASLLLWRDMFPEGRIAGLDVNPMSLDDDSGRVRSYQGLQQDRATLDRIGSEVAPDGFDVIVDDASHLGRHTAASFWHLFPHHLKPGGVYVIEDWGTGYWPKWPDGHPYRGPYPAPGVSAPPPRIVPSSPGPLARLRARLTGAPAPDRFPSHDYGMVGFVKTLVDAVAVDVGGGLPEGVRRVSGSEIASVKFMAAQVFVQKAG
jgi:SAM-dependent methyltransferase